MSSPPPAPPARRLRAGIVGGGRGAFIGAVHRIAAELDGQAQVVAGAMSSRPRDRSRQRRRLVPGARLHLLRGDGRAEAAAPTASTSSSSPRPIICTIPSRRPSSPPASTSSATSLWRSRSRRARSWSAWSRPAPRCSRSPTTTRAIPPCARRATWCVTGQLGELRKVMVEYTQDWLMEPLEARGNKQADVAHRSGARRPRRLRRRHRHARRESARVRDRSQIEALCADLSTVVPGRRLDDDANLLLRLQRRREGHARVLAGGVRRGEPPVDPLYGSKAGLEWHQQEPNTLIYKPAGRPGSACAPGRAT